MRGTDFPQSVDTPRPDQRLDKSNIRRSFEVVKRLGGLFLYVDIDPHFLKLPTPMEKFLSPDRTCRHYEFVRDIVQRNLQAGGAPQWRGWKLLSVVKMRNSRF